MGTSKLKLAIIFLHQAVAFACAFLVVRKAYAALFRADPGISIGVILIQALFLAVYFYLMWRDLYSRNYHYYLKNTYRIVLRNSAIAILLVLAVTAALSAIEGSPFLPALLIYLPVGALSFFLVHGSHFLWIRYLSRIGYFRRNCLIIGSPNGYFAPESFFQDIGSTKNYVGRVCKLNGHWEWRGHPPPRPRRIVSLNDVKKTILKENIGEIVFIQGNGLQEKALRELLDFCHALSIGYFLVPDPEHLPKEQLWNKVFPRIPVLERFCGDRDSLTNISLKRFLDIFISLLALLLFLPLGLMIALAIKLEDGGPVFYAATRIGKDGRPIRFYKFRTMVVGADRQKKRLMKFNQRRDGPLFKMRNDPRVTRVGRILRNRSLDEFPQMLNVLLGSMSLVGPRPHLPEEVREYKEGDYLRLECIPGIVCLPQIAGRNTLGFKEWVRLDLKYRRNWTLRQDFKIMLQTARLVLSSLLKPRSNGF
jgi:exopolysaccharide biosynthesis polyprenyl glycosylphosphotransferase